MLSADQNENRMIALLRLLLAVLALTLFIFSPDKPGPMRPYTALTLGLYVVYAVAVYYIIYTRHPLSSFIISWSHWLDVGWWAAQETLSFGANSLIIGRFFFPILIASLRWGFLSGVRVVLVSTVVFTLASLDDVMRQPGFDMRRFLLRPVNLLTVGVMIAFLGDHEIRLKRRLALLKEVSRLSNPRFGVDRMIGVLLEKLRAFYDADSCLLVLKGDAAAAHSLYRIGRGVSPAVNAEPAPPELAARLLALPAALAVSYSARRRLRAGSYFYAHDVARRERSDEGRAAAETIAPLLEVNSLASVPLIQGRNVAAGRLFMSARRRLSPAELDFMIQAIEHTLPAIENIRLVDRLATEAAESERLRIARDIHDSIIQPYIGLQIGLGAMRRKIASGDVSVAGDADQLMDLTRQGIEDLRAYVTALRDGGDPETSLPAAVRRFAAKFGRATGIEVAVEAADEIRVSDRLAAEAFQIVAEGVSNIRRHTDSPWAAVRLSCCERNLTLAIRNQGAPDAVFTPRSIVERTAALGGQARIEIVENDVTAVTVVIPL